MAKRDSSYANSKVGIEQDAERMFIDSDGYFNVANNDVTGAQLKSQLYDNLTATNIANAAGVLATKNLPSAGVIVFSCADAASNASAWFTSGASIGQELIIFTRGVGSTVSILISTSGVSIVGTLSGDLSSIIIHTSANSHAWLHMKACEDGAWSIISKNYITVIEQGSS